LTSTGLEGFQLIVYGFTEWYFGIASSFPKILICRQDLKKPARYNMCFIRSNTWVSRDKVFPTFEQYLKAFVCNVWPKHESVRSDLHAIRQSLKSPPIDEVPSDHALIVWLQDNRSRITRGDATTEVVGTMQHEIATLQVQGNANSAAIIAQGAAILALSAKIDEKFEGYKVCHIH